jgi:hypothetical protein
VKNLGFSEAEWDKEGKITVLRACALSPYAHYKDVFEEYAGKIEKAMQSKLERIYQVDC